jgi:dipeptidyl aminopeptidase/acylaminoacyl peptidase
VISESVAPNDLFSLRFIRDARLSPDGEFVAYGVSRTVEAQNVEYCELWIRELRNGNLRALASGDVFATAPRWSPDGRWLAFVSTGADGRRIHVSCALTGETREITPAAMPIDGAPTWSPDGARLAVCVLTDKGQTRNRRITRRAYRIEGLGVIEGQEGSVRIFDLDGESVDFSTGSNLCSAPKWSPHGNEILLLATSIPELGSAYFPRLCTVNATTGELREVLGEGWQIEAADWCPDGLRIVAAGSYSDPRKLHSAILWPAASLWVVNADGSNVQRRTDTEVPHVGLRFDHDMPPLDSPPAMAIPDVEFAFVTVQAGGRSSVCRISLTGDLCCERVIGGNRSCAILDACSSGCRLLFWATSFDAPCDLNIARWDDATIEQQITDLNSAVLRHWPSMRVEHVRFVSADGLRLEGWYMARQDASGPQPTIMYIHGGPRMAVGCAFRFDFWMLAAHGYAVLFTNFRGSIGYGSAFSLAIEPDWGTRDYPDHVAAIDAAATRGLADERRLGVWGPSYGGFATAWLIVHTDRFRAAVAEASLTDWCSAYYLSDVPDWIAGHFGGRPRDVPEAYRLGSPLTSAYKCKTPTLVLHGEEDVRCPMAGAESFFRALLDAGCIAELVKLRDCGHMGDVIGPLSARLGQNEALLDWFDRHL